MRPFCWLFGRIAITLTMAFGFLTFGLVKKEIWIQVCYLIDNPFYNDIIMYSVVVL